MQIEVPVSQRAVVSRLSRALAKKGKWLRKARGKTGMPNDFAGQYYIVDDRNTLRDYAISVERLEKLAREKGALRAWEVIRQE